MVHLENISTATHRDLFSFVDFFTCAEIKNFIGNSVSKFSTNQIALRNGMDSTWYNSRSIPIATIFSAYNIPIVYTYTEESQAAGKSLLKASILSVRGVFGITTNIHVLYHGTKDKVFLNWLDGNGVIVHSRKPAWLDTIEEMRLNALSISNSSSVLKHSPQPETHTHQKLLRPFINMNHKHLHLLPAGPQLFQNLLSIPQHSLGGWFNASNTKVALALIFFLNDVRKIVVKNKQKI